MFNLFMDGDTMVITLTNEDITRIAQSEGECFLCKEFLDECTIFKCENEYEVNISKVDGSMLEHISQIVGDKIYGGTK